MTNSVRFTFRMPKELSEKIKEMSEKNGVSVNAQILQILWAWVNENEKGRNGVND